MVSQESGSSGAAGRKGNSRVKILFLCTGNTCRSQMAEGLTRHLKADAIEAYSAGVDPGDVNPRAVQSMAEIGIDISGCRPKSIDSLGRMDFDYVVTLCDHANESCPLFSGKTRRRHVGFEDPPRLAEHAATEEKVMNCYRRVRDEIRAFVEKLPDVLENGREP